MRPYRREFLKGAEHVDVRHVAIWILAARERPRLLTNLAARDIREKLIERVGRGAERGGLVEKLASEAGAARSETSSCRASRRVRSRPGVVCAAPTMAMI